MRSKEDLKKLIEEHQNFRCKFDIKFSKEIMATERYFVPYNMYVLKIWKWSLSYIYPFSLELFNIEKDIRDYNPEIDD